MMSQAPIKDVPEDVLLIFVGHSSDANEEAKAICELERELQRELDYLLKVMRSGLQFSKVKVWEWNYDADPEVGGQEQVIKPYIQRANIG